MKRKWLDKNITILGLSKSGISGAKYLSFQGANCTISEKREAAPQDAQTIKDLNELNINVEMGGHTEETLLNSYAVISSPGIPPTADVYKFLNLHKINVISEIECAYQEATAPFIAITGTNGKTTTTKLVSEILTAAGYNAPACGNIGVPPTSLLDSKVDYFVTEVSSYQIDTSKTFKPQIGCFLNYTPDHIDWHGSVEAYFEAKASLFTGVRYPRWAVLNACDSNICRLAENTLSEVYFFGKKTDNHCVYIENDKIVFQIKEKIEEIINLSEINIFGEHNYQNIMAAVAIAKIAGVENTVIKEVLLTFAPPEHRLEYVDTIDNVKFFNDSKATNCDSTICALKAFSGQKVVLIAGGRDKGTDLTEFVDAVKQNTSFTILIGEATERFFEALTKSGYNNIKKVETLEQAVDMALDAKVGDVLFSPACASFDMFKNFEERGRVFKNYVIGKK